MTTSSDTCGIYLITNNVTGKQYVGQSIHIEQRIKEHQYKRDISTSYLENSIAKYGWENFTWQILCECPKEDLDSEEAKFIALYGTYSNGYNLTKGGDFSNYGNPMHNSELKQKNIEARKGFQHSDETKFRISQTKNKTGFYGVFKEYDKNMIQGFSYRYDLGDVPIRSRDINKLEYKVKKQGLKWLIIDEEMAKKTIIESETLRMSRENSHPTGFFRVILHKDESAYLGFFYRYSYPKGDGSRGYVENRSIEKLKERVLRLGLPWIEFDTPNNCINGEISTLDRWV